MTDAEFKALQDEIAEAKRYIRYIKNRLAECEVKTAILKQN